MGLGFLFGGFRLKGETFGVSWGWDFWLGGVGSRVSGLPEFNLMLLICFLGPTRTFFSYGKGPVMGTGYKVSQKSSLNQRQLKVKR